MDSRAPQNSEATDESPLVCESVWFAQQLYEDAEANYHVHLQTSQDGQNGLLDPSNLILTIDGQKKSFDAWTLEYANTYYPNLGKEVIKIPCLDFTPSSASVKQLRVKQNDAKPNSSEHQETPPPPPCTQRKTKKERKKEKAEKGTPIPGAYELEEPDENKVRGLKAERIVRESFEQLGKELGSLVMIAGYNFDSYLSKLRKDMTQRGYSPQRASEIKKNKEMDLLVLRENSGPLLIEVKSFCPDNSNENHVKREMAKLLDQLSTDKQIFDHIMKDLPDPPRVTKICALPNVSWDVLSRVYDQKKIPDEDTFILCREELQGWTSDGQPSSLRRWWEETIVPRNTSVPLETVRRIVGRFAGLLSTVAVPSLDKKRVEVRTLGDAVHEVGRQMSLIVLTKQQREILSCPDRAVHIQGPPGSGKTLLLALKAVMWIEMGKVVYVGGLCKNENRVLQGETARGTALKKMIEELCLQRNIDFSESLKGISRGGLDGSPFREFHDEEHPSEVLCILDDFYDKTPFHTGNILKSIAGQSMSVWWASSCTDEETTVDGFSKFTLNTVLRCPPVIQRLLKKLELVSQWKMFYLETGEAVGFPTDGPPVWLVRHSSHRSEACSDPPQCQQCVGRVWQILQRLDVYRSVPEHCNTQHSAVQYKDILFLSQTAEDQSELSDLYSLNSGDSSRAQNLTTFIFQRALRIKHRSATGFSVWEMNCRALNNDIFYSHMQAVSGVPLTVCDIDTDNLYSVGNHGQDALLATYEKYSWGLERKVVVFVMTSEVVDKFQLPAFPPKTSDTRSALTSEIQRQHIVTHSEGRGAVAPKPGGGISVRNDTEQVHEVPNSILENLSPHQQNMLYIAASRCTSQLIIVLP